MTYAAAWIALGDALARGTTYQLVCGIIVSPYVSIHVNHVASL